MFKLCVCVYRTLSITTGERDLPSQPMLEWISLKVLGASKLLICMMARCSKAFLYPEVTRFRKLGLLLESVMSLTHSFLRLSKQQIKWEEFIILNMVITSMLGRLW